MEKKYTFRHLTKEEQQYIENNLVDAHGRLIEKHNEYLKTRGYAFATPSIKQQFERQFYEVVQQSVESKSPDIRQPQQPLPDNGEEIRRKQIEIQKRIQAQKAEEARRRREEEERIEIDKRLPKNLKRPTAPERAKVLANYTNAEFDHYFAKWLQQFHADSEAYWGRQDLIDHFIVEEANRLSPKEADSSPEVSRTKGTEPITKLSLGSPKLPQAHESDKDEDLYLTDDEKAPSPPESPNPDNQIDSNSEDDMPDYSKLFRDPGDYENQTKFHRWWKSMV